MPGAGKSVLSAFLIDLFRDPETGVFSNTFFYMFKHDSSEKPNSLAAIQSLVYQLYKLIGSKNTQFMEDLAYHSRQSGREHSRSTKVLWQILCRHMSSVPNALLILDGLDECDSLSELLENLKDLAKDCLISIIVVSQPNIDVRTELVGCFHLEFGPKELRNDILAYVEHEVSTNPEITSGEATAYFKEHLMCSLPQALMERSNGSFIWANLVLKEEFAHTISFSDVVEVLDKVPSGLNELYGRILHRLAKASGRDVTAVILKWLACAARPLSLAEVGAAPRNTAGGGLKRHDAHDQSIFSVDKLERACGSLVLVDNEQVRLAHGTIRKYLQIPQETSEIAGDIKLFFVHLPAENQRIAAHCIDYMSSSFDQYTCQGNDIKRRSNVRKLMGSNPLLEYAVLFWLHHLMESDKIQLDRFNISMPDFLLTSRMLCWLEIWFTVPRDSLSDPDRLWRLRYLMKSLSRWAHPGSCSSSDSSIMLSWAEAMIELLDRHGPNLVSDPSHIHSIDPSVFVEENSEHSIFANFRSSTTPCYMRQVRLLPTSIDLSPSSSMSVMHRNSRALSSSTTARKPYGMFQVVDERGLALMVDSESDLPTLRCQELESGLELAPVTDPRAYKGYYCYMSYCLSVAKDYLGIWFWGGGRSGLFGNHLFVWKIMKNIDFKKPEHGYRWSEVTLSFFLGEGRIHPGPQSIAICADYIYCPIGRINLESGSLDDSTKLNNNAPWILQKRVPNVEVLQSMYAYSPDGTSLVTYNPGSQEMVQQSSDLTSINSSVAISVHSLEIHSISRTGRFVLWRDARNLHVESRAASVWYLMDFQTHKNKEMHYDFDSAAYARPIFSANEDCILWLTQAHDRHSVQMQNIRVCYINYPKMVLHTSSNCTNIWNISFSTSKRPVYVIIAGQLLAIEVQKIPEFGAGLENLWSRGRCLHQQISVDGNFLAFLGLCINGVSQKPLYVRRTESIEPLTVSSFLQPTTTPFPHYIIKDTDVICY